MSMKKRILRIVVVGSTLVVGGVMLHRTLIDGLDGFLFSLVLREDTEYAPGYSDDAFSAVHAGMSGQRVLELLGEPLQRVSSEGHAETWRYSRSPSDSHYGVRAIRLVEGHVVAVFHEFYVD